MSPFNLPSSRRRDGANMALRGCSRPSEPPSQPVDGGAQTTLLRRSAPTTASSALATRHSAESPTPAPPSAAPPAARSLRSRSPGSKHGHCSDQQRPAPRAPPRAVPTRCCAPQPSERGASLLSVSRFTRRQRCSRSGRRSCGLRARGPPPLWLWSSPLRWLSGRISTPFRFELESEPATPAGLHPSLQSTRRSRRELNSAS